MLFRSTATKAEYIMDVNQKEVEAIMQQHGVTRMIHGHTHRPAVHRFSSDGKGRERIVLGDWYEQSSCLRFGASGGMLEDARVPHGDTD